MKGKKILLGVGLLLSVLSSNAQEVQPALGTLELTLPKAIEIALAENPTIKVADKDVQLKKLSNREAWQNLLPTVSATGSVQHTLLAAEMKLNGQSFKMGKDGTNTAALSGTLNLPLFAPAVYATMSLTKQDILLAEEKARGSRLDLINQVTLAYYQLLLAKESYNVMLGSYNVSKENYELVEKQFQVGKVSEYDKISADVQMRRINSNLVSATNAVTLAELQLKVLMGVTENVSISLDDKFENYEAEISLSQSVTADNELQNNSTMRQFELNRRLLEKNLKIQRTNFMPSLAFQLTGQYQSLYNDNWNLFKYDWSPSASFAIALSIPIFTASNWTKLKTTKLQIAQLDDNKLNTQRQLNMAVESYKENMTTSLAQIGSNKEAVVQAQKAVSIAEKRYEVGKGTILELNQSEVDLIQAQYLYNQSIYNYLENKANLDYTLGRSLF